MDFIQLNQPFQQIVRVKEGEIVRVQKGQEIGRKGLLSQNDALNPVFRDCASCVFGALILNSIGAEYFFGNKIFHLIWFLFAKGHQSSILTYRVFQVRVGDRIAGGDQVSGLPQAPQEVTSLSGKGFP